MHKRINHDASTRPNRQGGLGGSWRALAARLAFALLAFGLIGAAGAQTADIRVTKHNFSKFSKGSIPNPNTVKATNETEVCVFCHTPHGGTASIKGPLWNRATRADGTYTRYTSGSLAATANGYTADPRGSSLLCLSCHDGLVALGDVNVLPTGTGTPPGGPISGLAGVTVPAGSNGTVATSGFTRLIGTDLSNDHPISITYDSGLTTAHNRGASAPEELRRLDASQRYPAGAPAAGTQSVIGLRSSGVKPLLPLEPTGAGGLGQVQCGTCHDPHLTSQKFLRLNRFQINSGPTTTFNQNNDQICLACHPKLSTAWAESAHAKPVTADETYTAAAAALRGFSVDNAPPKVWQVACLNCHDTHTAQGSRRLLRDGVRGNTLVATGSAAGATFQQGYDPQSDNQVSSAIENTCFQCHRDAGGVNILVAAAGSTVPSIKSLFDLEFGMPIKTEDQATSTKEVHNVLNSNLIEDPVNLGFGNNANRHAECPDCHNPHRLRRNRIFAGTSAATGDGSKRTHDPAGPGGNIASGVLRGSWGVEPVFGPIDYTSWPQLPVRFDIKQGEPGPVAAPTSRAETEAATYLTREYQLCFKCHSNYSNGALPGDFAPIDYAALNTTRRGTPTARANGMTRYTNVAAEFGSVMATDPASSSTDQGEFANGTSNMGAACSSGDCVPRTNANNDFNHRSWHPAMNPTGRDRAERKMADTGAINLRPPFDTNIGKQTMHCSDCHGQESSWTAGSGPTAGTVQGPHGSSNPFLLRGAWTSSTSLGNVTGASPRQLCGNCHQPTVNNGGGSATGFNSGHVPDGDMSGLQCMRCHIAVPHGWKNKAFLVNLSCVGSEGGKANTCTSVGGYGNGQVDLPPYYWSSKLYVSTWARSGNWSKGSCGGNGEMDKC